MILPSITESERIAFPANDAGKFNKLRDQWRDAAAGTKLPKVAHKIASLLPGYVSREYGYAFPTDDALSETMKTSTRNVGKGMAALDDAGLIERQTMVKRDARGEAIGRLRRIYLTMPKQEAGERNTFPDVNGTNWVSEPTNVFRIVPDRTTPDKGRGPGERRVSAYVPARESLPLVFGNDTAFLDTFDRVLMAMTDGKVIGAGEIERITAHAFDDATKGNPAFLPFYWSGVCALNDTSVATWFRSRAGALVHRKAA